MSEHIPPFVPSAETLRDLQDLTGWNLKIPTSATLKGQRLDASGHPNAKFSATWQEQMEITSSSMRASTRAERSGCYDVVLKMQVVGDGDNTGRKFTAFVSLDPAQVERGARATSPLGKGGLFNMHRLNELLRAIGYTVNGQGVNYTEYFHSEDGVNAQVQGQRVTVTVRHYVGNDGKEYQDAQGFAAIA
jgi:hypothetical protein